MQKTTVLICVIASLRVFGEWLGDDAIMSAAARWLAEDRIAQMTMKGLSPESVVARDALRVVSLSPAGYIVFSGSDLSDPVISFSCNAYIEPVEGSPFYDMLAFSSESVEKCEAEGGGRTEKWAELIGNRDGTWPEPRRRLTKASVEVADSAIVIEPFMTMHWNQWQPYNDFAPVYDPDADDQLYRARCPCGCVATATAQQIAHCRWPWRTGRRDTWVHSLDADGEEEENGIYAESDFPVRFDGHVPFEWDALLDTYAWWWGDARGQVAESERYPIARLVSWVDVITKMNFGRNGSGANFGNTGDSTTDWYETWEWHNLKNENPDAVAKIIADFGFGVPVHVGVPGHAVVGHGFAYDKGTGAYYLYINYGWGGSNDGWYELYGNSSPVEEVFTGFRPKKMVQLETLPKVCGGEVEVKWHLPECHANTVTGFELTYLTSSDKLSDIVYDFWENAGAASNTNKIYIAKVTDINNDSEVLVWENCTSGTYQFDGVATLTSSSLLEYRVQSSFAWDGRVVVQASFDGGPWQTISIPAMYRNVECFQWTTHRIFLGDHAGETVSLRLASTQSGGDWARFDDFILYDVIGFIETKRTAGAAARSCKFSGLAAGRALSIAVKPLFPGDDGILSEYVTTRIAGAVRSPSLGGIIRYETNDMVYSASEVGDAWCITASTEGDTTIKGVNCWAGAFSVCLRGNLTEKSRLIFDWFVRNGYNPANGVVDELFATFVDSDGNYTDFLDITNETLLKEKQNVDVSLSMFAGKTGEIIVLFRHYASSWGGDDSIVRFYNPKVTNIAMPCYTASQEWKSVQLTALGTPRIESIRGRDGMEIDEGLYRELGIGEDVLRVKCSPSVTSLKAYPSHLTYLADEDITVEKSGPNEFLVKMDTSKASRCQRMILTLAATDSNGTCAYRDVSLRFDDSKAIAQSDRWRKIASFSGKPVAAYTFDNSDTSNSGTGDFWLGGAGDCVTYEDSPLGRAMHHTTSHGPSMGGDLDLTNGWTILSVAKASVTNNGVIFAVGALWSGTSRSGFALASCDSNTVKLLHWLDWEPRSELVFDVPDATEKYHAYAIRGNGVNLELFVDGIRVGSMKLGGIPDCGFQMFSVINDLGATGLKHGAGEAIDDWRMYYSALPDSAIAAYTSTLMQFDEEPAGVAVEEGGTVVPESWFAKYRPGQTITRAQLLAKAANGRSVWECYVAGLDPNDEDDDLVPEISFEGGVPKVSIANGRKASRQYRIWGRKSLSPAEAPVDVTDVEDLSADGYEDLRFFHISVELP